MFAAYFLEAGLVLIVAPWSAVWERNRFTEARPVLAAIQESPYARGGVTGVGVITAMAGLVELGSLFAGRGRGSKPGGIPPSP